MTLKPVLSLVAVLNLLLAACGDSDGDTPLPDGPSAAEPATEASTTSEQATTELPSPDEIVFEGDPEIAGTEPLDSGLPMADAAPMSDEFSDDVTIEETPAEY